MNPLGSDVTLVCKPWVKLVACGLFISSGKGKHPDRILNSFELIVVRKGTLAIWENDVRFDVPTGHSLLLYPGRRHRGAGPFGRDLSFYWIHFELSRSRATKRGLLIPQFVEVQRPNYVAELFRRYLDDQESRRLDPFYANLLLMQILCEVARKPSEHATTRGSELTRRVEAYVGRHFSEELSSARISKALRLNPDYLNRVFHEVHSMTLTEFIHRRRIEEASGMLRDTTDSEAEIATACGFKSSGYFAHLFKRYRGVTPQAYRRLMARAYVNAR